jgi:membrane protein YdbS with pleckstrin-like domain
MYTPFRQFCERLLRIPRDPEAPPGDESSTRIFRAAPNYYRYLLCVWGIRTLIILPEVLVVVVVPFALHSVLAALIPITVFLIFVLLSLFSLAVIRLEFEKRWYIVTDRSLRVREGVIGIREMTVNFANIQNISISQGPLQRILGISDLRVDTAGGGGSSPSEQGSQNLHTAWFRGIENANEVRGIIQDRLRHLKDSGLGDHEELIRNQDPTSAGPEFLAALRAVRAEATGLRLALSRSQV